VNTYGNTNINKGDKYYYAYLVEVFEKMAMESGISSEQETSTDLAELKNNKEVK
jgi:hypothetical protein